MWIFYISIGNSTGNATESWILVRTHGKQTVSTKQPQVKDLTVGLPDFGEVYRYRASFQLTRLFHSATNFFNQAD